MTSPFHGIFTPLVTPITETEEIDLPSLQRLVEFQLEGGVHGLWAMGTTAEFAGFDEQERASAVETVVRSAARHVPVVANVSAPSTRLTIRHARRALVAGADAIAATPPYYYPHSQDELLVHYRAIRAAVDLPLFIYNIPQTVRVRVDLMTAQQLATEGTVAGIKDSQNDLEWFRQLVLFTRSHAPHFSPFIGTRALIDSAVMMGGAGAIPSMANSFPDLCVAAYEAAASGDIERCNRIEARIIEIESAISLLPGGSRNAAVLGLLKTILYQRSIIDNPALTTPLRTPTAEERRVLLERVGEGLPITGPR